MARPRINTVRQHMISLRLTVEERFCLMERANKACTSVSEFLRMSSLARRPKLARIHRIIDAPVWPADVYREVHRIGVNVNQIARQLNSFPERGVPAGLDEALAELRDVIARVRDRYGPAR